MSLVYFANDAFNDNSDSFLLIFRHKMLCARLKEERISIYFCKNKAFLKNESRFRSESGEGSNRVPVATFFGKFLSKFYRSTECVWYRKIVFSFKGEQETFWQKFTWKLSIVQVIVLTSRALKALIPFYWRDFVGNFRLWNFEVHLVFIRVRKWPIN